MLFLSIYFIVVVVVTVVAIPLLRYGERRLPSWVGWLAVAGSCACWFAIFVSLLMLIAWVPTLPHWPPAEAREASCYLTGALTMWVECGPDAASGAIRAPLANLVFFYLFQLLPMLIAAPLAGQVPLFNLVFPMLAIVIGAFLLAIAPYALVDRLFRLRN